MAKKVPENFRLRPRELFFIFLGLATTASLAVLWFRLVPELLADKGLDIASLTGLAAVVMHLAFQIPVLVLGLVGLAAGIATRTGSGSDRATWILAGASIVMFGMLLLSVNALYEPVFLVTQDGGADADARVGIEPIE